MANALRAVIAQLSAMKSYLALGIGSMGIATVGILVKFIGKDANFMTIMFYRVFFGAIFLLATVPFMDKKAFTLTKKDLRDYFFVGTLWTIGAITYVWAFQFAPVQNVVLLHSIYPFFVFILAGPLLGERITRTKVISAAIGLVGLVILNPLYPGEYAFGNLMAIISAVLWALIVVEMKKKNKGHDIGNVMWQFVFAAIVMLPTPFFFGLGNWAASWPLFLAIGAVSTGAAYIFYNYGLQRIEAQESSIIMTIINPVFSILLAAVLLSETVELKTIAGGAILVGSGIYLATHKTGKKQATGKL